MVPGSLHFLTTLQRLFEGPPIGASPVKLDAPGDFHRDLIRELTVPEIKEIIEKCVKAALRAKKAGFDGVDINAGSSHLFSQLSLTFLEQEAGRVRREQGEQSAPSTGGCKGYKTAMRIRFPRSRVHERY